MRNDLPKGRTHLWKVMLELTKNAGSFTQADVYRAQNGQSRYVVGRWIKECQRQGVITQCDQVRLPNGVQCRFYRVSTYTTPVVATKWTKAQDRRQNIWNALRASGWVTINQLARGASTDDILVSVPVARSYVIQLRKAGYLALLRGKSRILTYRLAPACNTGPNAPAPQTNGIFDFNLAVNVTRSPLRRAA